MDQKNACYLELIKGMTSKDILPGARELIEALVAEGVKVGLGEFQSQCAFDLDNVGLTPLFDVVVDGNHLTLSKPDPEVFLKGAGALGLQPAEVVVFEDAVSGVQAAKSGGFFAVGVGDADQLAQADVVVPHLEGVTPLRLRAWQSE